MRILTVDDDSVALSLLRESLRAAGHDNIVEVESGIEALTRLQSNGQRFDCILLDIKMPVMDGIETCTRIRQMVRYRNTPIIMITALSERSFMENAFAAGATDYITKPFDQLELGARIRLAETLVNKQREFELSKSNRQSSEYPADSTPHFSIEEPIAIADVPRMISMTAMENFLLRLSRGKVRHSTAVALCIAEFEQIHARSSPTEALYLLTDVAETISGCLKDAPHLLTYCGHGEFLCLTRKGEPSISPDLAYFVQTAVDAMELFYDNGDPCPTTILMGNPAHCSLWSSGNPLQLCNMALASVSDRKRMWRSQRSVINMGFAGPNSFFRAAV